MSQKAMSQDVFSQEFANAAESAAARQNLQVVDVLTKVLRQKGSMLLWAACGAVVAVVASLAVRPYFTASTTVLPPQTRASSTLSMMGQLNLGSEVSGLAGIGSALQAKSQGDSFLVLLTAWPVQDAVIRMLHLQEEYRTRSLEDTRKALSSHTSSENTKGFVKLSVSDGDPKRAAAITNAYIEAVRDSMRDMALTDASERRVFYEGQLAKAKDELAQAEVTMTKVQQSSKTLSLDSRARMLLERAAMLRSQVTAQEVELQRLRSYLTDSNAQVQVAQTSLSALRGQLAQVESDNGGGGFTGGALTGVPAAELDFVRATREVKYREALYDVMAKQFEMSHIDELRTAPVVQVIEPAFAPEHKSGPHRSLFALGGFALGFTLRFALALYRYWRSRLHGDDVERLGEIRRAALAWR